MKKEVDPILLARINKAVLEYYGLAAPYQTETNFKSWLETQIPAVRFHLEEQGFEKNKNLLPFLRFILELNDIGMDKFMKEKLGANDFTAWKNPNANLVVPNEMNLLK